ncbi:unnamed protein product [Clonostachys rosea]|uniref:Uncharacterized protein n=1 Tax=Bionectria ochroleuca TaxID=29856 RepID=A0ABY6U2J3_BIOOC|nr:unnamed protein product [Clonostachys rosea]
MNMQPVDAQRDRRVGGDSKLLVLEGDVEGARGRDDVRVFGQSSHAVQHSRVATLGYGLHGGLAILLALLEADDGDLSGSSLKGVVGNVADTTRDGEDILGHFGNSRQSGYAWHLGDQLSRGVLCVGVQSVGAGVGEGIEEQVAVGPNGDILNEGCFGELVELSHL